MTIREMRSDEWQAVAELILRLASDRIPARFALDPLGDIQVLSPMHRGPVGVANLNQRAVWHVQQSVCRRLVAAGQGGAVVNIASITGLRTTGGASTYAVSKAAVAHMTRLTAMELARHDIRVNAIAPGYFPTDMTDDFLESEMGQKLIRRIPMRRTGKLQELDGPLLLLASPLASFITGAVLPVDGGHLVASL